MKVIGLTGGIATGKSQVASLLQEMGAKIVDADELAREVVLPGRRAWREIVDAFGSEILQGDQTINRGKLREIVFKETRARKKLESITHPLIRKLAQERIGQLADQGAEVILYMAPLLFENEIHLWLRPVILVTCDLATQKRRLKERDKLNQEEIAQHLRAQMPLEEKKKLADLIIDNSGDSEGLKREVKRIWEEIKSISTVPSIFPPKGPRKPGRPPE